MKYWTADEFREARLAMGYTQRALADRLDVGLRTIEGIEGKDGGCDLRTAYAMMWLNEKSVK